MPANTGKFETEDLTPTVPVGEDTVLELFRGPTSAFKDVALSMLPHLMTAAKKKGGVDDEILILTATSGDTGKAAMEGFCDVAGTKIIVFYPDGGVSAVQKAQMVTQGGDNTCVAAVRGNFDDAQTAVKQVFAKVGGEGLLAGKGVRLSSANSINIGEHVVGVGRAHERADRKPQLAGEVAGENVAEVAGGNDVVHPLADSDRAAADKVCVRPTSSPPPCSRGSAKRRRATSSPSWSSSSV